MKKKDQTLVELFKEANQQFLDKDKSLILTNVNERTLCGALAQHLTSVISQSKYKNYHVDVEYNRNKGKVKTIINDKMEVVIISCDLIVHSRGEVTKKDNLIALEMKKSTQRESEKQKDKVRLVALTKDSFDEIWSFDGVTLPKHVCGYDLGIYYEVNVNNKSIMLEYFIKGALVFKEVISL